jgi:hypothetical protein
MCLFQPGMPPTDRVKSRTSSTSRSLISIRPTGGSCFAGSRWTGCPLCRRGGIDVEPTDARIYGGALDKAFEYGGTPKLVLAMRGWSQPDGDRTLLLDKNSRIHKHAEADVDVESIQNTYPYAYPINGESNLYSRFPSLTGAEIKYDQDYGYWIPGDPFDALVAMFIYREQL